MLSIEAKRRNPTLGCMVVIIDVHVGKIDLDVGKIGVDVGIIDVHVVKVSFGVWKRFLFIRILRYGAKQRRLPREKRSVEIHSND